MSITDSNLRTVCRTLIALLALLPGSLNADFIRKPESITVEGIQPLPLEIRDAMKPYTDIRGISFVDWYGDQMIVRYRRDNTSQLFLLEKPGAELKQLTAFQEPVTSAVSNAEKGYLVFPKDSMGDEQAMLFRLDVQDGSVTPLTQGQFRTSGATLNNRGSQIAFADNSRDQAVFDVYIMDPLAPHEKTRVFKARTPGYPTPVWSPSGEQLLISVYVSVSEVRSYLIDLREKTVRNLTPRNAGYFRLSEFTSDPRFLVGTSDSLGEFRQLIRFDLKTNEIVSLTAEIPWDASNTYGARDGSSTFFRTNEDGISKLHLLDHATWKTRQINFETGVITGHTPHRDGSRVAFTFHNARNNGNVYVISTSGAPPQQWTQQKPDLIDIDNFVEPELIHFPTFDRLNDQPRLLSAFYYSSPGKRSPGPVVIYIHGGPESQFRPGFLSPAMNYWINELGIGVIAPNVRGSAGYGKSFLALDNGRHREDSVRDIGALLDWINTRKEIDPQKVAVYGGSYGGYMVLASLVHFSERLAVGIERVGISNFVTFLRNTSDYRRELRRAEYGNEETMTEFLTDISPLHHAEKIRRPLFVVQGAMDPRVPVTESEQLVEALRSNQIPVWYLLAENEGHGFRKKDNRDYRDYAMVAFLRQYLLR